MKQMKRIMALLLCAVMVLSNLPTTAFAASASTNLTYSASAEQVRVGDTVTVTVTNEAMNVTSFACTLNYDKSLLKCTGITGGRAQNPSAGYLYDGFDWYKATAFSSIDQANEIGQVGFAVAGTTHVNYKAGTVFTATFEAIGVGTADFSLVEDSAGDEGYRGNAKRSELVIKRAPATNVTYTTTPADKVTVGDTVTVTVTNADMNVRSFTCTLLFDDALLKCTGITGGRAENPTAGYLYDGFDWYKATGFSSVDQANENSQIGFALAGTQDADYVAGTVFTATFEAIASGIATFTLEEDTAGDYEFNGISKTSDLEIVDSCPHTDKKFVYDSNDDGKTHTKQEVCAADCGKVYGSEIVEDCSGGEATCDAKAECENCGQSYGDYKHDYGELIPEKEPVHTQEKLEAGVDAHYQCDDCGKYFTEEKVEAEWDDLTGEVPTHDENTKEQEGESDADCENAGTVVDVTFCSQCRKEIRRSEPYEDSEHPALGHAWALVDAYAWSADNSACTAQIKCQREKCGKEQTVTGNVTFETTNGTCSAAGETVYTATFAYEKWTGSDTKTVPIDIDPNAHAWNTEPASYENVDETYHTPVYTCQHNAAHTKQGDAVAHTYENGACVCGEKQNYTVTWTDENGKVHETDSVEHGESVDSIPVPPKTGYTGTWVGGSTENVTGNVELQAEYTPNNYQIVWMVDDEVYKWTENEQPKTHTVVVYDTAIEIPDVDPVKEGHTFQGWYTGENGTGILIQDNSTTYNFDNGVSATALMTEGVEISGQTTLYAHFTVNPYTVTFNINGEKYAEKTVNFGEAVTAPAYTVPEGYSFSGWDLPATMPAENISLNATLTVIKYAVTFNINGEMYAEETVNFGEPVTAPSYTVPEGYTFSGWDVPATMPAQNLTLNATLTANYYTITYDLDGGALAEGQSNPAQYTIESGAITLVNPTKTGHTFAGWTGTDLTEVSNEVTIPAGSTGNREYKATWAVNQYKVTWVGTVVVNTQDYGTELKFEGELPKKTGFVLKGWNYFSADGKYTEYDGTTMPAYDIYAYPIWEQDTTTEYTITFYDGETMIAKLTKVLYEGVITAPQLPEKEGYTFVDWVDANGDPMPGKLFVEADQTYYAKWQCLHAGEKTYTDLEDGNHKLTCKVCGEALIASQPHDYPYDSNNHQCICGAVEKFTITVCYDVFGADVMDTITAEYGADIAAELQKYVGIIQANDSEFIFEYWCRCATTQKVDLAKMPAENLSVYAYGSFKTYTVTWFSDGEAVNEASFRRGGAYKENQPTAEELAEKEGHTFTGWKYYTDEAFTDEYKEPGMPAQPLYANAQWTPNKYAVTLTEDSKGVEIVGNPVATYGDDLQVKLVNNLAGTTNTGVYFRQVTIGDKRYNEYSTDNDDKNLIVFDSETNTLTIDDSIIKGDVEICANALVTVELDLGSDVKLTLPDGIELPEGWTLEQFLQEQVGFTYKEGKVIHSLWVGAEIELSDYAGIEMMFVKEGYSYDHIEFLDGSKFEEKFILEKDTQLKTVWKINQYNVTLMDGNETVQTMKNNYGETTQISGLTKEGHTFTGWNTEPDGSGDAYTESLVIPAHDVTLYAQWKVNTYDVTFTINGEQYGETVKVPYGEEITVPPYTAEAGYTFSGWTVDETMPAENKTYDATLTANTVNFYLHPNGGAWTNGWEEGAYRSSAFTYGNNEGVRTWMTLQSKYVAREGYSFKGWTTVRDDASTLVTIDQYVLKPVDVELYALWEINTYDVTWKIGEETVYTSQVKYGDTITAPDSEDIEIPENYYSVKWDSFESTMGTEDVTVNGHWTVYLAILNEDGTTQSFEQKAPGDTAYANYLGNYYKEGHTFWLVNANDETEKYTLTYESGMPKWPAITMTKNLTLKPVFEVNTYTISWKNIDGETLMWETVEHGQIPQHTKDSKPAYPAEQMEEGYTYTWIGWSAEQGGEMLDSIPAAYEDEDYYAVYEITAKNYYVTWYVDGEFHTQTIVKYGDVIAAPEAPTKVGYTFTGWQDIPESMPAKGIEIYGEFVVNKHDITWNVDGKTYHSDNVAYGAEIALPDEPTKEGHTFTGWKDYTAGMTMPDRDVTFAAQWQVKTYTVTWTVDEETYATTEATYGQEIPKPETDPQKTGYTFSGWDVPATMPDNDQLVIAAEFTVNTYVITWVGNGGIWYNNNLLTQMRSELHYGSTLYAYNTNPSRTGYKFIGWNTMPDGSGEWWNEELTVPAYNVSYFAQWEIVRYKVTMNLDGGVIDDATKEQVEAAGGEVTDTAVILPVQHGNTLDSDLLDFATKTGYTYVGFSTADGTVYKDGAELPVTGDTEITLVWEANQYQVSWFANGGAFKLGVIEMEQVGGNVPYGSVIAFTGYNLPIRPGYTFTGWNTMADGSGKTLTAETVMDTTDNLTAYYAQWEHNGYTITWDVDGVKTTTTVKPGQMPVFDGTPEKATDENFTYTFAGWDKELVPATEATTYTAVFTRTGWDGDKYLVEDEVQMTGWTEIGDAWYYLDPTTGDRAEGTARVPYPAETIDGNTYAPAAGTIDAEKGWFLFGEDGKFLSGTTGIGTYCDATRYAQNGHILWNPGLVEVDSAYYYFTGDETKGGNILATGDIDVAKNSSDRNVTIGGTYTFGEDGKLCEHDGITDMTNGTKRYYQDAQLMKGAGLVKIADEKYIFVRANGELVVGKAYWVPANDLNVKSGIYSFDDEGFMINPIADVQDGFYYENGGWYCYRNGKLAANLGLIQVTNAPWFQDGKTVQTGTGLVYVRSNGQLAVGTYYITNVSGYTGTDYVSGDKLPFNEYGLLANLKNGIYAENGSLYYYVDNSLAYNAGVIQLDGKYYYVKSTGEVVNGKSYWITNVGDSGVVAKQYTFAADGTFEPVFTMKEGIIDGYYYVNDRIAYAAGLLKLSDENGEFYIYVRSNGQLATGKYWPTTTNGYDVSGQMDFGPDGKLYL